MQLHRAIDQIHAAGAELIVIGNGAPHFIAGFREITHFAGPIYTDPSLHVFEVAELKRGLIKSLNLKSVAPTLKALKNGFRQGSTQGDPWQQGGVLIIAPPGDILWQHASERPGDNATPAQVLAALA